MIKVLLFSLLAFNIANLVIFNQKPFASEIPIEFLNLLTKPYKIQHHR